MWRTWPWASGSTAGTTAGTTGITGMIGSTCDSEVVITVGVIGVCDGWTCTGVGVGLGVDLRSWVATRWA